ncbi:MAG: glucose dehydrogenase [Coriobacteriaceae bacterium]|nr:glucose dehydrogenase [Coriobacteriaceae bacterium]
MRHARAALIALAAALALVGCGRGTEPPAVAPEPTSIPEATSAPPPAVAPGFPSEIVPVKLVGGLDQPVFVTHAGDGSGRLFVVEKTGRIRILRDGKVEPKPFLDISGQVSDGSEQGLLGLAFSPTFEADGYFYVDYTDRDGDTVVARYHAAGDAADRSRPKALLTIDQPYANHNGGMIAFGPDGMLYVGMGDGGSAGDPQGHAQNPKSLLGKLLRIDVSAAKPTPEVAALGLRNPWRFSFDRETGEVWIGDVGQGDWEEIDYMPAGDAQVTNFGWNRFEGSRAYRADSKQTEGFEMPVAEYGHDLGRSVTGGYVYRGTELPVLDGMYLYADFVSGRVWGLRWPQPPRSSSPAPDVRQLADTDLLIASFGEDEAGVLYLCDLNGAVYRVEAR